MLTINDFDVAAATYDNSFTHTQIGKLQRQRVYYYIRKHTQHTPQQKILEVNCGTGVDAIWLAQQGHEVLATDISLNMLEKAKENTRVSNAIAFKQLDVSQLNKASFEHPFDMIFSNFGGLNCINAKDLAHFFDTSHSLLNEKGILTAVLMPKKCLWERLYFISKGQFKKAFRRNTTISISANVDGAAVKTWYFNPKEVLKMTTERFTLETCKPIGFMVPPSYLEPFFRNKGRMLSFLGWLDRNLTYFNWLSSYADHFILILRKK